MKVLVTGVAGFVGSTLAREMLNQGHEVVGIDMLTDYYDIEIKRANLNRLQDRNFRLVQADLLDENLTALLDGVNVVFHQAGQPGVRKSWGTDFDTYTRQNINATQRLLEACVSVDRDIRVVYASSSSVYGDAERYPTTESDRPQPVSPYGVTKLAAEHLCSLYAANFGLSTVSLRYFTVYGPRQRPDMAFTRFLKASVLDEVITLYGTGDQIRDFTYVSDVVQANILAAQKDSISPGTVLNVAGGSNISVNEVLEAIASLGGRPLRIDRQPSVKGDVFRTGGSTEAIEKHLGWQPTVSIYDGLALHYEWAMETFG